MQSEFSSETGLSIYTVFTGNGMRPGIFSKMAGVLAATGLQIVSAQILTREDGIALDTFRCIDLDYQEEPPAARRAEVVELMTDVLEGRLAVESLLGRRHSFSTRPALPAEPTQVEIDNESSDRFTILEVFADDRQGLLYVITRTIFEAGLSIHSAKISTRLDQVADAFYVTDADGRKIEDVARLDAIRTMLIHAIDTDTAAA